MASLVGVRQRRIEAEEKVPCPGGDSERLTQQLPMRGLWDPGKLLSKSKPPGHRTCWNLEPLSVADQHSSLLFAVV